MLVLVLFGAEAKSAFGVPHERELHADERDAADDGLAFQQRPGREIDIGFGSLCDEALLGVENTCAQNDEIDPPLVARPFDGRLVVLYRDAGKGLGDRVGECATQRTQRDGPDKQPDHSPNHKKDDGRPDPARHEGGMADVMSLDVLPKEQIPLPGS